MDAISVVVRRGDVIESRHSVHAVAFRDGGIVDSAGNASRVTFLRSAAKPFQAIPLVRDAQDLPEVEVAIASASHEAGNEQLAAVRALLDRADASEDDLECGPEQGSRLRHNCSGKHAAMLVRCHLRGWRRGGYRLADHDVQRDALEVVASAAQVAASEIETGVDGCGVVAFALPLWRIASMFGRLVRAEIAGADRVVAAMRAYPELVGSPTAADTRLMVAVPGAVAKRGAEGVLCAGLPDGTGIAVKVEDGANRAAAPAIGRFLGVDEMAESPVFNSRGETVGSVFPCS